MTTQLSFGPLTFEFCHRDKSCNVWFANVRVWRLSPYETAQLAQEFRS